MLPAVPLLSIVLRIRGRLKRAFLVTSHNGHKVLNVLGKYLASHMAEVSVLSASAVVMEMPQSRVPRSSSQVSVCAKS